MSQLIDATSAARERLAGRIPDLPERRHRMELAAERMPAPQGVTVEAVDVDGVPCEWNRPERPIARCL